MSAGRTVKELCAETSPRSASEGCAGSLGDVATFSFFAAKLLTSGEGGAGASRNSDLVSRICLILCQGMGLARSNCLPVPGTIFRIGGLHAASLSVQLNARVEFSQTRETVETAFAS